MGGAWLGSGQGPGRHRLSCCHPSQLRPGLGCSPCLCLCRGVLGRRHLLCRSRHTNAPRPLKFGGGFPHRALSMPFRSSLYPCHLLGLTPPSDLFLSLMPSSPVPTLSHAHCSQLWDHLPLVVDPCAHDHGGCSPHANCTNVAPGQRTCTCLDGYTGDGELCQGEAGVCPQGCGFSGMSETRKG